MKHKIYQLTLLIAIIILVILCWLLYLPATPEITPTLIISQTPSTTPTQTATSTAIPPTKTLITLPTVTASHTPEPTVTPVIPTSTPTIELRSLIEKGDTYWWKAKEYCNDFSYWQLLKRLNGWYERALPIGEYMRIKCND